MKQKETKNRMGTMDIGISGTDADGGSRNRNRCRNQCAIGKEHRTGEQAEGKSGSGKCNFSGCRDLCGLFSVWLLRCEAVYRKPDAK